MEENKKAGLLRYGVLSLIALVTAGGIAWYEISMNGASAVNWLRFLCDGFFVAGILLICFGAMLWISQAGGFHGLSYLFYSISYIFTANKSRFENRKDFYTYKTEKEAKAAEKDDLHYPMLTVGGISFALSLVFLLLFHNVR